jgi:hypothetical protein
MKRYVCFDGMTWPNPKASDDLEWRLRYAAESITREDQLVMASFLAAYRGLISMPSRRRNQRVGQIRRAVVAESAAVSTSAAREEK